METVAEVEALFVAFPGVTAPKLTAAIGLIVIEDPTVALSATVAVFEFVCPTLMLANATTRPSTTKLLLSILFPSVAVRDCSFFVGECVDF
jgi:hypothetical protein